MKTRPNATTSTPGKTPTPCRDAPPAPSPGETPPCEIGPFARSNYYTGKLLTERELTAEQRYHINHRRLHDVALHGWGAVCGLKVVPAADPHCRSRYLVVEPGVAVDGAGREIRVRAAVQIALPQPPPHPPSDPCPPEYPAPSPPPPPTQTPPPPPPQASSPPPPAGQPASPPPSPPVAQAPGQPASPPPPAPSIESAHPDTSVAPAPTGGSPPPAGPSPPAATKVEPWRPMSCPEGNDLYICIRYVECKTEFTPAPFDDCGCSTDGQQPNRIAEGFEIDILEDKPDGWDKIATAFDDCTDDCEDLYGQTLCGCADPCWPAYIPLAVVRGFRPGHAVAKEMIDNRCSRPILPSTRRLDQLVRCILDKVPARTTTRIRDFNWSHGHTYDCHDFHRWFVEDHHGPRHFEVAFTAPVIAPCLSPIVFQATVLRHERHHERGHERGGFFETVPATVWPEHDGTKFFLRIEKWFADHCLRGASFDLYLTLHCDVVLDHWGVPVDGDLLARLEGPTPVVKPPTGDGIPGGTFRSWIRVHA
jgi:hypothetical protein